MQSRETKILIALLLTLASVVIYRVITYKEPERVRELTYKPGASRKTTDVEADKKAPPSTREMKGLGGTGSSSTGKRPYSGVIRNLFQPLYPKPPVPVVTVAPPPPVPPPVPFPAVTARGPSQAEIESGKIKFLGFVHKEGEKKIFLSKEKEVYIVKKGDTIGSFLVEEITDTSVSIKAIVTNEQFRLPIEDQKPLRPGTVPGAGRR